MIVRKDYVNWFLEKGDRVVHLYDPYSAIPAGTHGTILAPLGKAPSRESKYAVQWDGIPCYDHTDPENTYWISRPYMLEKVE